jgi:hypothetical protein
MGSYACAIEQEMQGQLVVNVVGFALGDTFGFEDPDSAAQLAERVAVAWKARIVPRQSSSVRFLQVVARGAFDAGIVGLSSAVPVSGGNTGASLPAFAAVRVVLQSAEPRRAGRGRTGISGVPETDTDSTNPNNLSAAALPTWATAWSGFVTDLAATAPLVRPVVISRVLNLVPRLTPLVSLVTSSAVRAPLGTRVSRIR